MMILRDKTGKRCKVAWKTITAQKDREYKATEVSINGEDLLLFDRVVGANEVELKAQYWLDGKNHPSHYLCSQKFQYLAA